MFSRLRWMLKVRVRLIFVLYRNFKWIQGRSDEYLYIPCFYTGNLKCEQVSFFIIYKRYTFYLNNSKTQK